MFDGGRCFVAGSSEVGISFHQTTSGSHRAYIYFLDDGTITWSSRGNSRHSRHLMTVAVHEIGHVLGLGHDNASSTMQATYPDSIVPHKVEIHGSTRQKIKDLYGKFLTLLSI